ncbi:MAG: hypothetical protein RR877_10195 [Aurantimicrobium sp.]|uniref:hypothetical protein n=1 Tax=Aurantimicrobium sp. TaxID=1930784 RepID=UPI002FC84429
MIYTVALHTPARMLTIEADRFYVDNNFLVFTSGGGEDYGSNGGRPAGFPVAQILFVTAESAVHTHRVFPNASMIEPRLIDEEELARARHQLSYAPAIRSVDTTAPRVPAFPSSEGRLSAPHFDAAMAAREAAQYPVYNITHAEAQESSVSLVAHPPIRATPVGYGDTLAGRAARSTYEDPFGIREEPRL